MKKICAFLISAVLLFSLLPANVLAYGKNDKTLSITHINTQPNLTDVGIIVSGEFYDTLGELGTFAWWRTVSFDWNETEKVYEVVDVKTLYNNFDKSSVRVPDKGFVYGISLTTGTSTSNQAITDSHAYVANINVGDKAYLYGTDLKNGVIINNGENYFDPNYVSESYIKIGEPDEGKTPYNPDESTVLGFDIKPNTIGEVVFETHRSIIATPDMGRYVDFGDGLSLDWWTTVVFDWDSVDDCYKVVSTSKIANYSTPKQPIIPETGFALIDHTINSSAIAGLKYGTKVWLYDIDIENETLGENPVIRANLPFENREAYDPGYDGERLDSPVINELENESLFTTADGTTITWDAVDGAEKYVVAINKSKLVADGTMALIPTETETNSFEIPSEILELEGEYTLWIYAVSSGKLSSPIKSCPLYCVSETALNSNLRDKTVVAFGDSLTAITGWVKALKGYIGTDVINAGIGGNNTNAAKARFKTDVLDKNPDVVLILFGSNDQAKIISTGKPNVSHETYRANMEYFAEELTSRGIDVIFITSQATCASKYRPSYGMDYANGFLSEFYDIVREIALEYNCGLIDIHTEAQSEDLSALTISDGLHLSDYGQSCYTKWISNHLLAVYDNINKAETTVKLLDDKGNVFKTKTYVGAVGAKIKEPIPQYEGYKAPSKKPATVTLKNGVVEFLYEGYPIDIKSYEGLKLKGEEIIIETTGMNREEFLEKIRSEGAVIKNGETEIEGTDMVKNGYKVYFSNNVYTVVLKNDIDDDGEITTADAIAVLQYISGYETELDLEKADVNGDLEIDVGDAVLLLQRVAGYKVRY